MHAQDVTQQKGSASTVILNPLQHANKSGHKACKPRAQERSEESHPIVQSWLGAKLDALVMTHAYFSVNMQAFRLAGCNIHMEAQSLTKMFHLMTRKHLVLTHQLQCNTKCTLSSIT